MQELPDAHTPLFDPPQAPHIGIADAVEDDEELPVVEAVFEPELCVPELRSDDRDCDVLEYICLEALVLDEPNVDALSV